MKNLRPTGTFAPVTSDAAPADDASDMTFSREESRLRRDAGWQRSDLDLTAETSVARDVAFGASATTGQVSSPRSTLVPAGRGTGATLRPAVRSYAPASTSDRIAQTATMISRQELAARTNEMFDGVCAAVTQLVATLEDNQPNQTTTRGAKLTQMRAALRSQLTSLKEGVARADQGRKGPSCLTPVKHRQINQFASSFDAYDRRIADENRPEPLVFSPEQALLLNLKKGLKMQDKVRLSD